MLKKGSLVVTNSNYTLWLYPYDKNSHIFSKNSIALYVRKMDNHPPANYERVKSNNGILSWHLILYDGTLRVCSTKAIARIDQVI